MNTFGIKILTKVLIPYTFGIFFIFIGIKGIKQKKELIGSVLYTIGGLVLSLGAIWHLLFVANISMYS